LTIAPILISTKYFELFVPFILEFRFL
jgi:hypothetical protein